MIPEKIHIRRAERNDLNTLVRFNAALALETENKELNPDTLEAGVNRILENTDLGFYLIAERNGQIVGSLMITYEWSDWRNGLFWWIQSVYILPEYRRQGIYRKLYAHVKKIAKEAKGICGFRLYVDRNNRTAQKTYNSLGMHRTDYWLYEETNE